ncbi:unnamed protein product [Closterium sp. Naga37s-1]|nr:unnamed protein product [Closterium sp. Naga37s-1]
MSYMVVRGSSSDFWHQNEKLFDKLKPYFVVTFVILVLGVPLLLIFQPIEALSTDVAASDAPSDDASSLSFEATRSSGDSAAFASYPAASSLEAGVIKGVNIAWSLCRAEAAYWADIDRRKAAHNGDQWPMDSYDLPQLLLSVLMPTYPCPAEERVGAWGDGGKVRMVRRGVNGWVLSVTPYPSLLSLLLSVLMPTYPCPAEERVGAWGDGGKVSEWLGWVLSVTPYYPPPLLSSLLLSVLMPTYPCPAEESGRMGGWGKGHTRQRREGEEVCEWLGWVLSVSPLPPFCCLRCCLSLLMPTNPCLEEERVGAWGNGGKVSKGKGGKGGLGEGEGGEEKGCGRVGAWGDGGKVRRVWGGDEGKMGSWGNGGQGKDGVGGKACSGGCFHLATFCLPEGDLLATRALVESVGCGDGGRRGKVANVEREQQRGVQCSCFVPSTPILLKTSGPPFSPPLLASHLAIICNGCACCHLTLSLLSPPLPSSALSSPSSPSPCSPLQWVCMLPPNPIPLPSPAFPPPPPTFLPCLSPTSSHFPPLPHPIIHCSGVGSNEQYDFEQAIGAALHTKPFTFDPFLSANASHHMLALPFLHFNQIAIAGAASLENFRGQNPGITFMTLQGAMEKLGHGYVDVLKMDCEGCEEEFIMGMKRETEEFVERRRREEGGGLTEEEEGKRRGRGDAKLVINGGNLLFGQLLVEFHAMHKPQQSLPYLYAMEGMGYRMFHVEPNPLCYPCIEVAFVHEDLVVPPLSLDCAGVLRRSQAMLPGGCLEWGQGVAAAVLTLAAAAVNLAAAVIVV